MHLTIWLLEAQLAEEAPATGRTPSETGGSIFQRPHELIEQKIAKLPQQQQQLQDKNRPVRQNRTSNRTLMGQRHQWQLTSSLLNCGFTFFIDVS